MKSTDVEASGVPFTCSDRGTQIILFNHYARGVTDLAVVRGVRSVYLSGVYGNLQMVYGLF